MFSVAPKLSRRLLTRARFLSSTTTSSDPVLYMWGTNKNGTLLGTEDKLWDVPTEVEWRDILGVGLDIKLEQVVCGPTDTALVLSDGRCFTSGTNKYGQLG